MAPIPSVSNPHALSTSEILALVHSRTSGLTRAEAKDRLLRFGPNQLPSSPPPRVLLVFARQFINPLIYILLIVGLISLLIGHHSDAGFIFGILVLNAVIGTIQEYHAEQSALALRKMAASRSVVIREDENLEINSNSLVVGDLVLLESGNKVPADLRLLSAQGLEIDESLLTGESLAVLKNHAATVPANAPLGDRVTMAFAGTLVTRGRAQGIVTGTALNTELGKIAETVLNGVSTKTPLIIRMEKFTQKLAIFFSVAVLIVGAILLARGDSLTDVLLFAVALGVSAIPEGLPVALTVALSIASKRMAKRNVIVRKLAAVEALGSCTFIGTDKTGTLTVNELTARAVALPNQPTLEVSGSGIDPEGEIRIPVDAKKAEISAQLAELSRAIVLCNEGVVAKKGGGWSAHGDAVDIALLVLGHKAGITAPMLQETHQTIGQIPFESELQFSATLHKDENGNLLFSVKGALEKILAMCDTARIGNDAEKIDRSKIERQAAELANQGYRVLAIATGQPKDLINEPLNVSHLTDLTFLGLVGMIDPPRPEVKEAIRASHAAGIDVAMITGDHQITALAIARDLGLARDESQVVTGAALKVAATESAFDALVRRAKVFARVEPKQKLQITQSLIRQGHFMAVTGDGANDAPALKAAHVGVAMGKSGTDVAKETSDLIIADDRFTSIIAGIEEGRVAYANIRKVIYLLISTGAAEIILFVLSLLSGLPMPLSAIQLLWLNLVTNGIQDVALAFEPKEGDELDRKPRSPNEPIFNNLMLQRVLLSGVVMGAVSFAVFSTLHGTSMDHALIQNHILLLLVLFENVMIGNARSETKSGLMLNPFRNPILLFGTLAAQGLHIGAMHFGPMQKLLGTSPVAPESWLLYLGLALSVFGVIELHKLVWRLMQKRSRPGTLVEIA